MLTDSVDAGLVCIPVLTYRRRCVGCHLPMTNVYRERIEKGLGRVYWGLESRVGRFLDVYVLDKRKDSPKGESPLTGA